MVTAVAEIAGCYLPYLWLRKLAWLLSLHPTAAGRTYAAYGGVSVAVAIVWLWLVGASLKRSWRGRSRRTPGATEGAGSGP